MAQEFTKLKAILGDQYLDENTVRETDEEESQSSNSKNISCVCGTLILKPNVAKLILPSESMLEVEKDLKLLHHSDAQFKNLTRGCYWLVDDMYKFEQIGYTKEINAENLRRLNQDGGQADHPKRDEVETAPISVPATVAGLRYLACAECNLCPLGWYDPRTKESYLYVW